MACSYTPVILIFVDNVLLNVLLNLGAHVDEICPSNAPFLLSLQIMTPKLSFDAINSEETKMEVKNAMGR